ncbi:MAG: helix-turn-helix domain-containing protein [Candidatus Paceibacterota bacterium]|jgi:sugar-specific transcriptional regulator TrmB
MIKKIEDILKDLGFKDSETRVYIFLTQLGEATAAQVAKKADIPRTTAISILEKLKSENYLTTNRYKGVTYYWVESPKTIVDSFENKVEAAKNLNGLLTDLYRSESNFPYAQVYDTKKAIKQFIEKTLISTRKKSIIYTIDAPNRGNYTKIYSENIENTMANQKIKKGIVTYTLIPFGSYSGIAGHKTENQVIKIREMPAGINFTASFWFIDDLMVHFSGNPPFVAAIKHDRIVQSMKSVYDFLWNISEAKN